MQRPAAQPAEQRADCSRLAMQGGRAAGGWELCMAQIPDAVKWVVSQRLRGALGKTRAADSEVPECVQSRCPVLVENDSVLLSMVTT